MMLAVSDPSLPHKTSRAVVFDFDGLMIDSEHEIATCVLDVLTSRGATVGLDDIAHLFGSTDLDDEWDALLARVSRGELTLAQLSREIGKVLPARIDALPLLPGVSEVLDRADQLGWRVGLATGQTRPRLDQHLARLGVAHRFDAIVTAGEVARGKPAADIYLEAARRLGVAPGQCVALEDSLPGCHAALAAGMTVIVCPSRVTAGCDFPNRAQRVTCLSEIRFD